MFGRLTRTLCSAWISQYRVAAGAIPLIALSSNPTIFAAESRSSPCHSRAYSASFDASSVNQHAYMETYSVSNSVPTPSGACREHPSRRLADALHRADAARKRLRPHDCHATVGSPSSGTEAGNNSSDTMSSVLESEDFGQMQTDPSNTNRNVGSVDRTILEIRCLCEETAEVLEGSMDKQAIRALTAMRAAALVLESFQARQRERVNDYLDSLLPPNSIRARLFSAARAKAEARNAAAIKDLLERGGSVREKYSLLWQQQWARRESLVSIANVSSSSGVMRFFVEYMAGVPAPVLALARGLNSENGPAAQVREIFEDALSSLSVAAVRIRSLSFAIRSQFPSSKIISHRDPTVDDALQALRDAASVYETDITEFVVNLEDLVSASFDLTVQEKAADGVSTKEKLSSLRNAVAPGISVEVQQ